MKNVLKYKDFVGSVGFSTDDDVFYGKLEGLNDLVTFEGNTVEELKNSFHDAVEDYIVLCKDLGKDPYKSFKGSFNVRIKPSLHKQAMLKSIELGVSLNQFVEQAISSLVKKEKPV